MCEFVVIGISDNPKPELSSEALGAIAAGRVFSGGRRHREIVESLLPAGAEWIDITVPLSDVFERYEALPDGERVVVFASGDPLFFGFAATLQRRMPQAGIRVIPHFNSLQTLAHHMLLPYEEMRAVSLTGRQWDAFDSALIAGEALIGVLTDRLRTPSAVAARMLEYGYDNYTITVGEHLGNPESERISALTLSEAAAREWQQPNSIILRRTHRRRRPFGIPEEEFELLDGRVNMITKMPVRLLALSMLDLRGRSSLWDVGFCTGSVSIEARLQFPDLKVTSFERRPECAAIIEANARRHGAPGITVVTEDFLDIEPSAYLSPDAVFIGGHGGKLRDMLEVVAGCLTPGGIVVFNSVGADSLRSFRSGAVAAGLTIAEEHTITIDSHNPITIIKAIK